MTLEEIKQARPSDISTNAWLRELCLLVAASNEKPAPVEPPATPIRKVA